MKRRLIVFTFFVTGTVFGQIEQNINKNAGSETLLINEIDSIRFTSNLTHLEVVLNDGTIESHLINDINNVTFSEQTSPDYDPDSEHCNDPTVVVDVTNPVTGKTWMDRNLGASQTASSSTDEAAYGDLYQWGRRADSHQCRNSSTTTVLSTAEQPNHGDFIANNASPFDWLSSPNDNLWQGVNGTNNPCPNGYRLPTESELEEERTTWSSDDAIGAFASPLKLTLGGYRLFSNGSSNDIGANGVYWSSTINGSFSKTLDVRNTTSFIGTGYRSAGFSVRCIKE